MLAGEYCSIWLFFIGRVLRLYIYHIRKSWCSYIVYLRDIVFSTQGRMCIDCSTRVYGVCRTFHFTTHTIVCIEWYIMHTCVYSYASKRLRIYCSIRVCRCSVACTFIGNCARAAGRRTLLTLPYNAVGRTPVIVHPMPV